MYQRALNKPEVENVTVRLNNPVKRNVSIIVKYSKMG